MKKKRTIKEMYKKYENDPEFIKELMVSNLLADIFEDMEKNNISNAELARRMNVSRQYITKLFNGYANFTLMTLAQIAVALNLIPEISLKQKDNKERKYKKITESLTNRINIRS